MDSSSNLIAISAAKQNVEIRTAEITINDNSGPSFNNTFTTLEKKTPELDSVVISKQETMDAAFLRQSEQSAMDTQSLRLHLKDSLARNTAKRFTSPSPSGFYQRQATSPMVFNA